MCQNIIPSPNIPRGILSPDDRHLVSPLNIDPPVLIGVQRHQRIQTIHRQIGISVAHVVIVELGGPATTCRAPRLGLGDAVLSSTWRRRSLEIAGTFVTGLHLSAPQSHASLIVWILFALGAVSGAWTERSSLISLKTITWLGALGLR